MTAAATPDRRLSDETVRMVYVLADHGLLPDGIAYHTGLKRLQVAALLAHRQMKEDLEAGHDKTA